MSKGPTPLTQEQRDALNQVFYGVFRGAIGQNNFYREFSKRNQKQADSLEAWKNQKKTKKTPEQYAAMQAAGTLPKPWISARQSNQFVAEQETTQLMQDMKPKAKARAIVIPEDERIPIFRMQGDSIVLKGAKDGR